MKVAVLGAGAMGCLYGAALHRGGAEVTLVDTNPEHLAALQEYGLELERRSGTEILPIPALRPESLEGPLDLVLVFTKTFVTDAALTGIAHAIGPETRLLSLQNGLGNDRRWLPTYRKTAFWSASARSRPTWSVLVACAAMARVGQSSFPRSPPATLASPKRWQPC